MLALGALAEFTSYLYHHKEREGDQAQCVQAKDAEAIGQEGAAEELDFLGQRPERLAAGNGDGHALDDQLKAEGGDEGRHIEVGDGEALCNAQHQRDGKQGEYGQAHVDVVGDAQVAEEGAGKQHERGDGEVDAARGQAEEHADGEDHQVCVLHEDVADVHGVEQRPPGGDAEEEHHQEQRDHEAIPAKRKILDFRHVISPLP